MVKRFTGCFILGLLSFVCSVAGADIITDATGEVVVATGFDHLDIDTVTVTDDGTNLTFSIDLVGDIAATDWGKYMVGIDSSSQSGGDTAGNGWGRPISFDGTATTGMDFWLGTWVDAGGGGQLWDYGTGSWVETGANIITPDLTNAASGTTTFSVSLANLGLNPGDTITFDAYASGGGGGDGAWDAASDPTATTTVGGFGDAYVSYGSGQTLATYTIGVPEPGSIALLTLFGVAGLVRRRR